MRNRKGRILLTFLLAIGMFLQTPGFSDLGLLTAKAGANVGTEATDGMNSVQTPSTPGGTGVSGENRNPGETGEPGENGNSEPTKKPDEPLAPDSGSGSQEENLPGGKPSPTPTPSPTPQGGESPAGNRQQITTLQAIEVNGGLGSEEKKKDIEVDKSSFEVTGGKVSYTTQTGEQKLVDAAEAQEPITDFDMSKGLRIEYQFDLSLYEGKPGETFEKRIGLPQWLADVQLSRDNFSQELQEIGTLSIDQEKSEAVLTFDRTKANEYSGYFWLEKKVTSADFGDQDTIEIPFTEQLHITIQKPQEEEPQLVHEYKIGKEAVNKGKITINEKNEAVINWKVTVTAPKDIPSAEESGKITVEDRLSEGELIMGESWIQIQKQKEGQGSPEDVDFEFAEAKESGGTNQNSDGDKETADNDGSGGSKDNEETQGITAVSYTGKTDRFDVVFNQVMEAGDVYTISYQSKVNVLDAAMKDTITVGNSAAKAPVDSATQVTITNTAELSKDQQAKDTVTIPVDGILKKSGNPDLTKNTITWTIKVNENNYNMQNAAVTDRIPDGLTLVGGQKDNYGVSIKKIETKDSAASPDGDQGAGDNSEEIQPTVTFNRETAVLTIQLGTITCGYEITFATSFQPGAYWQNENSLYKNHAAVTVKGAETGFQTSGTATWVNGILQKLSSGDKENPFTINWKIRLNSQKQVDMSKYGSGGKGSEWIILKDDIYLVNPEGDVATHKNRYKIHEFDDSRPITLSVDGKQHTFQKADSFKEITGSDKCYYLYEASEYLDDKGIVKDYFSEKDHKYITGTITFYIPSGMVGKNVADITYSTEIKEKFLYAQNINEFLYWNYVGLYMGEEPKNPGEEIESVSEPYKVVNTVLEKSGSFLPKERKIHWQITVNKSQHELTEVVLKDIISAFAAKDGETYNQTYLADSLSVRKGNETLNEEETDALFSEYPKQNVGSEENEGSEICFKFKDKVQDTYTISYDTEIEEGFFAKNQINSDVENQVTLISKETVDNMYGTNIDFHTNKPIEGVTVTATVQVKSELVSKSGSYNEEEQQQNVINWTVDFNKNKLTLKNPVVTDQLDEGLKLAVGTVELYKLVDGSEYRVVNGYEISYQEATNVFTVRFGLNEPKGIQDSYRLKFTTDIKPGASMQDFSNQVSFSASLKADQIGEEGSSSPIQKVEYRNGLGINSFTRTLRITKVDSDYKSREELLEEAKQKAEEDKKEQEDSGQVPSDHVDGPGEEPEIEEMDISQFLLSGAKFQLLDQYGNVLSEVKTTQNGVLEFEGLRYNRLYILREVAAPSGYYAGDDFVFRMVKMKNEQGAKVTVLQQINQEQTQKNYFLIGSEAAGEGEEKEPFLPLIVKNTKQPYTPGDWYPTDDPIPTAPVEPEVPESETPPEVPEEVPEETFDIEDEETPLGPGEPQEEEPGEEVTIDEEIPMAPTAPEDNNTDKLPQTGTTSVWAFYGMGMFLMFLGAGILLRKKRKN